MGGGWVVVVVVVAGGVDVVGGGVGLDVGAGQEVAGKADASWQSLSMVQQPVRSPTAPLFQPSFSHAKLICSEELKWEEGKDSNI